MMTQLTQPLMMVGPGGQLIRVPMTPLGNPALAKFEADRIKKALDEGSPHDLTPAERRERDKEIRRLEEELGRDMVPGRYHGMKAQDTKDYHKVVNELVVQMSDPARNQKIERLKNLRRERDADNPNAGNIENLRQT
jgi:hypothetical protein